MTVQNHRFPPKSLNSMHNSKTKTIIWKRVYQVSLKGILWGRYCLLTARPGSHLRLL